MDEMQPIARDVTCSVICVLMNVFVLGTWVSCAEIDKTIEVSFRRLTHVGSTNHVLDRGQNQVNPFTITRVTRWQCLK